MTFHEKDSHRHSGPTRSRRMRLPALGARGSMRAAGVSRRVDATAIYVAASVTPTPRPPDESAMPLLTGSGRPRLGTA